MQTEKGRSTLSWRLWFLFIGLAFCSQGAFAQVIPLEGGITVTAEIEKSIVDSGFRVGAALLKVKPGFKIGDKLTAWVDYLAKPEKKTVWPLINLDIFGKIAIGAPVQALPDFRPNVNVAIPVDLLNRVTGYAADQLGIVFYNDKKWVSAEKLVAQKIISRPELSKDKTAIEFLVYAWPIDDQMVGCDH